LIDLATFDFEKLEEELCKLFEIGYINITRWGCDSKFVNRLIYDMHDERILKLFDIFDDLCKSVFVHVRFLQFEYIQIDEIKLSKCRFNKRYVIYEEVVT
jgi:hypothetical protein